MCPASYPIVLLLSAWSFAGCGPSVRQTHLGNVRFEHCYALQANARPSAKCVSRCWQDWLSGDVRGQGRKRIAYAGMHAKSPGVVSPLLPASVRSIEVSNESVSSVGKVVSRCEQERRMCLADCGQSMNDDKGLSQCRSACVAEERFCSRAWY